MRTEADQWIEELRRRHWVMVRWGPTHDPALIAWVHDFGTCADVILLRTWGEDRTQSVNGATGYRTPSLPGAEIFNPEVVIFQYHSTAVRTLRAMLALPAPGTAGAPDHMEQPQPPCRLPRHLPTPEVIRPLGMFTH